MWSARLPADEWAAEKHKDSWASSCCVEKKLSVSTPSCLLETFAPIPSLSRVTPVSSALLLLRCQAMFLSKHCYSLLTCHGLFTAFSFVVKRCVLLLYWAVNAGFSQAKVLTGGPETCEKRKSTSPCVLGFLHWTASLDSVTDTLNLSGEFSYAKDLKALTDLVRD